MSTPLTTDELLDLVRKSDLVNDDRLSAYVKQLRATGRIPTEPAKMGGLLVLDGLLTPFHVEQILQGKWRRFTIGSYKVLERLGSGSMGSVYLCQHELIRRLVAVKVLPASSATDPVSVKRFYRETRVLASLDHPNIVRAYEMAQDDTLYFLVMEYVDGSSLKDIVKKCGPMDVIRVAHYIQQTAVGLQHIHERGIVHRDIKPSDILVDRGGMVKIIDMGLARSVDPQAVVLPRKYDGPVLGTPDYIAPEQISVPSCADGRADIYSLGATCYFCLTGWTPFPDCTVAQKLLWHQTRQPMPIRHLRPEVPEALVTLIERMMAKDPVLRPQTSQEVAETLAPYTQEPIAPPPEEEMPYLCPAIRRIKSDIGQDRNS